MRARGLQNTPKNRPAYSKNPFDLEIERANGSVPPENLPMPMVRVVGAKSDVKANDGEGSAISRAIDNHGSGLHVNGGGLIDDWLLHDHRLLNDLLLNDLLLRIKGLCRKNRLLRLNGLLNDVLLNRDLLIYNLRLINDLRRRLINDRGRVDINRRWFRCERFSNEQCPAKPREHFPRRRPFMVTSEGGLGAHAEHRQGGYSCNGCFHIVISVVGLDDMTDILFSKREKCLL